MRLAAADAASAGRTNSHRCEELPGAAIADARQFADALIEARIDVIRKLNLGDRAQAVHAHADRGRADAALGNGRGDDAVLAVLALQPFRGAKHAAEIADVLAHEHPRWVLLQHDVHGGVQGLNHVHAGHGAQVLSVRIKARCFCKFSGVSLNTSSNMRSASSRGPSVIVPKLVASFQLDATSASSSAVSA